MSIYVQYNNILNTRTFFTSNVERHRVGRTGVESRWKARKFFYTEIMRTKTRKKLLILESTLADHKAKGALTHGSDKMRAGLFIYSSARS